MKLTSEQLLSIEKITQILPIQGYVFELNLPLWFSTQEDANQFLNCIKKNHNQGFDLDRIKIKKGINESPVVNFIGTENMDAFMKTFMWQGIKNVIKHPLKSAHVVNFARELSIGVCQGEYAITSGSSKKPILGTHSAGACLIVAIYDSQSETGFLAHIDAMTDLNSLEILISRFNPTTSQVHLYGGDPSCEDLCVGIFNLFKDAGFEIYNSDILRPIYHPTASLAIDSRTGKIYSPVRPHQLDTPHEIERLQAIGLCSKRPLQKIHDGTEEKSPSPPEQSSSLNSHGFFSPVSPSTTNATGYPDQDPGFLSASPIVDLKTSKPVSEPEMFQERKTLTEYLQEIMEGIESQNLTLR